MSHIGSPSSNAGYMKSLENKYGGVRASKDKLSKGMSGADSTTKKMSEYLKQCIIEKRSKENKEVYWTHLGSNTDKLKISY